MKRTLLLGAVLMALASPAFAQTNAPAASPATIDTMPKPGQWRGSKLIGLDVYNDQNEKLGDISEMIVDASGRIQGYVIGVGGFLGVGEHAIIVEPSKLKFVMEAARTTGSATPGTTMTTRNTSGTTTDSAASDRAYPDHAVLSATKDQLKTLPQFKY